MFYGVLRQSHLVDTAFTVADLFALRTHNKSDIKNAAHLLLETAAAETNLGRARDIHTIDHGVGVCQFDYIGFIDTKNRMSDEAKQVALVDFGVNIESVSFSDLAYSPVVSMIMCRNFYMLRPNKIPNDVIGRAHYWKTWFNTKEGKGTIDHYVECSGLTEIFHENM